MSGIRFDTACAQARPVRLPEWLRRWAWESLHGRYGDEALEYDSVSMDDIPGYGELPEIDRYDLAIERIAELASFENTNSENIGARRLHSLIEKLLSDVSFEAHGERHDLVVDRAYVDAHLASEYRDMDLKRYII